MKRFVEQEERSQIILFPERLDDYVNEDNPVHVVDVFVEGLHLAALGFEGVTPAKTGRPAYHPAVLLKLYIYGYLNRIQSKQVSKSLLIKRTLAKAARAACMLHGCRHLRSTGCPNTGRSITPIH
jgi:transposase